MGSFIAFTDRLPEPNWTVRDTGEGHASSYTAGPGFSKIQFSSEAPVQINRTNSGRVITRSSGGHTWKIDVTYNPMTRAEFEPVYSFLLQRNGRLNPFYVVLPNQSASRSSTFTSTTIRADAAEHAAGLDYMKQDVFPTDSASTAVPQIGDMFTISDDKDSLHTKAYRVNRVTNNTNYLAGQQPATNERYVYFTPSLQRKVYDDAGITYINPQIRVILTRDIQEYSLGTNNLYQFSLSLEEAQA